MIDAKPLPKSPLRTAFPSQPPQKTAVRSTAATQNILPRQPAETDRDVTIRLIDGSLSEPGKTPQPKSSSERDYRNRVSNDTLRRAHPVFAAKQMDLMSERPQTFGGLKQIPFGSSLEIETFMNEGDLHETRRISPIS